MSKESAIVAVETSLAGVDAQAWNRLAGEVPLLTHAFFSALHDTGCASARSGWRPAFLVARRKGELVGALPLYEKTHSYGEYVFDWAWADAYRRHGRRYYPKLVSAIPFTPASGPRLLAADPGVGAQLIRAALARVRAAGASSLHVLLPPEGEARAWEAAGLELRHGVQFHWRNPGYRDFDDYLASMTREKRKKIRQERRRVAEAGVSFRRLVGAEIGAPQWRFFFDCYESTYREHHSTPYLDLAFFERIGRALAPHRLMVTGARDGVPLCAALNVFDAGTLWGRYWGATQRVPGLHFETCYYQAIEFCIERRIALFEGGAQGAHKLARGFLPMRTWSAHWIADRDFDAAIRDFIARERVHVAHTLDELAEHSPFRQACDF
jgi:predicted N-acyltransferase